jgi:diguanylate cyclase (GGDEF)-like protein
MFINHDPCAIIYHSPLSWKKTCGVLLVRLSSLSPLTLGRHFLTVALGELFSFEQLAEAEHNPVAEPAKQPTAEDIKRAIMAANEAAYKWKIVSDEMSWSDNASDILGCPISDVRSGKLFANLLDADNFTTRYETVMNSKSRDEGGGVPYHIEYMFRSEGRSSEKSVWVEDQGRWFAGSDGNPAEAYGTIRQIDERHRRDQHLNFLGNCDPLTGMMNRGRMTEALGEAISVTVKDKRSCAFAIAAVNNLSVMNEAYGFDVADEVIVALGRRLRQVMRAGDGIARFSGGKFGIILNECDQAELRVALERFMSIVRDSVIETKHGPVWAMLSIGAVCLPVHASDASAATARAEEALSEAIRQPSDGYIIFKPSDQRSNERALNARCATEIVQCLKEERFKLAFQPIVNAESGKVAMHEALLRMVDSTNGGLIAASHLVPISENLGLVRLIDRAVMQMIMKTLNTYPDSRLSMNVSGTTAMDPRWHSQLLEILTANADVAERLTVEVTETVALSNFPSTRQFVESLRNLGSSVAIDDFGAGFTSFRNLRDLPVNMIKLDGSFCQDLRNNHENEYIVRSLIDLAGKFKIKTVAEWVQHEEDAEALRSWGVDYLQGNLIGEANMTLPWTANQSSVFSIDIETNPKLMPKIASTLPEAAEFEELPTVAAEIPVETESAETGEFEQVASEAAVESSEPAEQSLEPEAPLEELNTVTSELQFSEIDDSISTLRQTLTELKNYFPSHNKLEGQTAA